MEATLIIKMPDGTTKTIELQNINVSTSWNNFNSIPNGYPFEIKNDEQSPFIGVLTLNGQIKGASLVGGI